MSGRARGKHGPRAPIMPGTDAGDGIGASERMQGTPSPVPGGKVHIVTGETPRQRTPVPDSPAEVKDLNAHGVDPGTHTARERAEAMRGPNAHEPLRPLYEPPVEKITPVPVRVVSDGRPDVLRTAAPRRITVAASTGEPVRLCGQSSSRSRILLLNESTSSDIRFAQRPSDLTGGGGSLLPWPNNSYLQLTTQDELWAISADSGTPVLSIIQEFDQPW